MRSNGDYDQKVFWNYKQQPELSEEWFQYPFSDSKIKILTNIDSQTQQLLLNIFYNFTTITPEKIDDLINLTLKGVGELCGIDRCNICWLSEDAQRMVRTNTWLRKDVDSRFYVNEYVDDNILPWSMQKMRRLEVIKVDKLSELPSEAAADRTVFYDAGVKSLAVVPITYQGSLLGCFGFDAMFSEREWSDEIIYVLTILADIYGAAYKRKEKVLEVDKLASYYHTVFENTGSPSFIIGENMEVLQSSMNWDGVFGYTRCELENNKWMKCLPEKELEKLQYYHHARREELGGVPQKYTSHIFDKFGRMRDCLMTVAIIPGTKNSVVTLSDITQYNRIGRAMKVTTAISTAQLHAVDEQTLLQDVCQKIVDIGCYRFAWIGYISKGNEQKIIPVAHAGVEDGYLDLLKIKSKRITNNDLNNMQKQTGIPRIWRNIAKGAEDLPWREEALERGYKGLIAITLELGGEPERAVLAIYSGEEDVFDDEEVALVKETAEDLVFGIKYLRNRIGRAKTAEKLENSLRQKDNLLLEIVDALAASVEAKDPYTAGHQKRVGALTKAIVEKMNLTEQDVNGISIAGSIHDIGKIQIPSEILCKPGTLLGEEFALIKTHSKAGYDIIKNIDFPYPVADILLQHHERLDGSGYPKGLYDEEILLGAKIVAVADVVEAISAHRPYRPALGIDRALEEIERMKGIQFDKQVVEICLSLFREDGFKF